MSLPSPETALFHGEPAYRVAVQVPEADEARLRAAILAADSLKYGDYDSVTFTTQPGIQRYRSLGTGRNAPSGGVVEVPCAELAFLVPRDPAVLTQVLQAIHQVHPYEEPVVVVTEALRTRHVPGSVEDNPNKFWNRPEADWVPGDLRTAGPAGDKS
ncbi:hypothetical protein [Allosediminivita pacifica]|uniref:Divalent cation tolerance protein n=1 Tax=Allosediminivita pacifica TaxID=1267769 RepID=A0A2T6AXE4_9RHOB|nr:hypothetical protein [Allosediminivita pacifica]PTX48466.1 hypothetical protein C8N44_109159 [Allosediminivita pacifica]GGB10308.1 hypothetical protein GCM10011324_20420 [Allosediminivita pacifica]